MINIEQLAILDVLQKQLNTYLTATEYEKLCQIYFNAAERYGKILEGGKNTNGAKVKRNF